MAGIKVSNNKSWIVANWVFCYLGERLLEKVSVGTTIYERITEGLGNGTKLIDFGTLDEREKKKIYDLVVQMRGEIKSAPETTFQTPEALDGFRQQLASLISLIEDEWI
jgi:hypothetical protein